MNKKIISIFIGILITYIYVSPFKNNNLFKLYALSPYQAIENKEFLSGKEFKITGRTTNIKDKSISITGNTGRVIEIVNQGDDNLKLGKELILDIKIDSKHRVLLNKAYRYSGITKYRVLVSILPIPVIIIIFFREFRLHNFKFERRKNYDMD
ncbi:MAG: hypothetical protein ACE5EA_06860 [Nitrospirota bacterium]